ncbi:MAG TPA: stage II sporulation protein R [Firmicutes bacterium]|nr:stage II sporulation protein R [Bacillota bacterium]
MKKRLFVILLAAFLIWGLWPIEKSEAVTPYEPDQIIRLHIRAQDDSQENQDKKLLVRDSVNEFLKERMLACNNIDEARRIINEAIEEIEMLAEQSSGQDASVWLGKEYFPDRVYAGVVYPAGEYEALIIELNGGAGQNWWCVAYPPLCYTSVEADESAEILSVQEEPEVVYHSRILEFFHWLCSLF